MLNRCLLCMRIYRGDARYCSQACADRCTRPIERLEQAQPACRPVDAMKPGEAARALGLPLSALRTACHLGKLPWWKAGRRWWVDRQSIERLIDVYKRDGKVAFE